MVSRSVEFSVLLGKTIKSIKGCRVGSSAITIHCTDGYKYKMEHDQDCCEIVLVNDVTGKVKDIVGLPLTLADESVSKTDPPHSDAESFTWTFYKLATLKGFIDIRWLGESNGFYSEEVTFREV